MKVIQTVRSCFRYMSNTERRCSVCWMREFACIIYDGKTGSYIAARDPIEFVRSITDMTKKELLFLPVEAKNLVGLCEKIRPFPPGTLLQRRSIRLAIA